jgi:hypothetical protein
MLVIWLVYWSLWSDSFLGGWHVMNSCMFTCVISHLIGLHVGCSGSVVETLSYGIWRIPVLSCRRAFRLCRGHHQYGSLTMQMISYYFIQAWNLGSYVKHRIQIEDVCEQDAAETVRLKREQMTGEWRKSHNKELHNLYSSPHILRVTELRKMRWVEHVECMEEKRSACKIWSE